MQALPVIYDIKTPALEMNDTINDVLSLKYNSVLHSPLVLPRIA